MDRKTDVNAPDWALRTRHSEQVISALDWYRDDHGERPKSLEALVPRYLSQIPSDKKLGNVFTYKNPENSRYELNLTEAAQAYVENSGLEDDIIWRTRIHAPGSLEGV